MKFILSLYFILQLLLSLGVSAYSFTGPIKEISNPIKILYTPFQGSISGQNIIEAEILNAKEITTTKGTVSIKKNNNRTVIVEYIFEVEGGLAYKIDIYTSPQGKVKNYLAWSKNKKGDWDKIKKSEINKSGYKKIMNLMINSIIFDYSQAFKEGDIIIEYPFREILGSFFSAEGTSRGDFQMTNKFNFLDSIPKIIGAKLKGKTCFNGRSAYIAEYNIDYEYANYPSKSSFIMKGYQLIDEATGLYFHGRYKISLLADFGETLDSGINNFDMYDDEKFDLNFQNKNCEIENILNTETQLHTDSEKKKINDSFEEKLIKLKSAFIKDLITKEEYDQKRKEILDEL